MSLDTDLTNQQEQRTEQKTVNGSNNGNGYAKKSPLCFGLCPYYKDCKEYAENYYCLQSRQGLIFHGEIVCYKPNNK